MDALAVEQTQIRVDSLNYSVFVDRSGLVQPLMHAPFQVRSKVLADRFAFDQSHDQPVVELVSAKDIMQGPVYLSRLLLLLRMLFQGSSEAFDDVFDDVLPAASRFDQSLRLGLFGFLRIVFEGRRTSRLDIASIFGLPYELVSVLQHYELAADAYLRDFLEKIAHAPANLVADNGGCSRWGWRIVHSAEMMEADFEAVGEGARQGNRLIIVLEFITVHDKLRISWED